jgi:hypothetical protein
VSLPLPYRVRPAVIWVRFVISLFSLPHTPAPSGPSIRAVGRPARVPSPLLLPFPSSQRTPDPSITQRAYRTTIRKSNTKSINDSTSHNRRDLAPTPRSGRFVSRPPNDPPA